MGVNNVAGRQNKCGHGVIMYTYPAWTFGGKHKSENATLGPGPGLVLPGTFNGIGPGFGHPHRTGQAPAHGPHNPGALPQLSRGPAHSFGTLLPKQANANPGPQDYKVSAWPNAGNAGTSWGPPPSQRATTAPRPMRVEEPILHKTKGPSFGLPYRSLKSAGVPGPNAYQPLCNGCCQACEGYKGHSFGLRPPMMYGKVTTITPGPVHHVECSTIGAATQNCESGSSTFRNRSRNRSA